jgi:hypothetical protein
MKFNNHYFFQAFENKKIRYLLVGGWNTFFGYLMGVFLFLLLNKPSKLWEFIKTALRLKLTKEIAAFHKNNK